MDVDVDVGVDGGKGLDNQTKGEGGVDGVDTMKALEEEIL